MRGGGDDIGVVARIRMQPRRDEPSEMCHVDHEERAHRIGDLAEAREIPDTGISAAAGNDHAGLVLFSKALDFVEIDALIIFADAVVNCVIGLAGKIQLETVREVAAMSEAEAENGVTGLENRGKSRLVGLRAGMRLHVDVFGPEEPFGAVARKVFGQVGDFAAAVIALARVALGVLIGEDAGRGFETASETKFSLAMSSICECWRRVSCWIKSAISGSTSARGRAMRFCIGEPSIYHAGTSAFETAAFHASNSVDRVDAAIDGSNVLSARQKLSTSSRPDQNLVAIPARYAAPERRRLHIDRPHNWTIQNICLKLHQKIVASGASVHAQLFQLGARIRLHRVDEFTGLVSNAFQRRARDVSRAGGTGEPGNQTSGSGIPIRRSHADKRRNEHHSSGIRYGGRERLGSSAVRMMPILSRSHCTSAPDTNTLPSIAKAGEPSVDAARVPSSLFGRRGRGCSRVQKREAAGAIRVLRKPRAETSLTRKSSLLIARDSRDRNRRAEMFGRGFTHHGTGGDNP